jgi:hypothetical protein
VLGRLAGPPIEGAALPMIDPAPWLGGYETGSSASTRKEPEAALAAAFLVRAAGPAHSSFERASAILDDPPDGAPEEVAHFFRRAVALMRDEVEGVAAHDPEFAETLGRTADRLREPSLGAAEAAEACWALFFPEAVGIIGDEAAREAALRTARTITIRDLADDPLSDPGREILFTSNVLLTLPATSGAIGDLPYPPEVRDAIRDASGEPQRYWYDHPIQIGVPPEGNELLYGLRSLDKAIGFERRRADPATGPATSPADDRRVVCLLSVSVTHEALHKIGRLYVEEELARSGPLEHLDVHVLTEADARRLLDEVLLAEAERGANASDAADGLRAVFGVDGEYGRHYSFLKAIAALWHVLIDPGVRATFKIDLDQVFPQDVLVAETGESAFEHLATPRWGAVGTDAQGHEVDLGMIAGALVNERDIGRGLFTPDVAYPGRAPTPEEHVFSSALPQALSTQAEMMTRYGAAPLDGTSAVLERIHVTGGTNGIRVDALRRHRPFTPSFIGRAEDQAYVLSTLGQPAPRLAYVHEAGLIMRHDKEAFAGDASAAAHIGKLIGDDVRILYFSAYVRAVAGDGAGGSLNRAAIKSLLDPFTGGFVSRIPLTVVVLRFALRTLGFFARGEGEWGREYALDGARRLTAAMDVTTDPAALRAKVERERAGWARFYDALDALEAGLEVGDPHALRSQRAAHAIIDGCRVRSPVA